MLESHEFALRGAIRPMNPLAPITRHRDPVWLVPREAVASRAESDGLSVAALRRREPKAVAEFFRRYHERVVRILRHAMGPDHELPDLVQEAFAQALRSLPGFRGEVDALGAWVGRIAVFTARRCIRTRRRRSWLRPWTAAEGTEAIDPGASPVVRDTLRRAQDLIDRFPPSERMVFGLRFVDGRSLNDVAVECRLSLATVKRRLTRARARFEAAAAADPFLCDWLRTVPGR